MDNIKYWSDFGMSLIRKQGFIKPTAIKKILEMDDFKSSGFTEQQLDFEMSEVYRLEMEKIYEDMRRELNELKKES